MTEDWNPSLPVSDRLLGRLVAIAREARAGRACPAAAEMMLHLAPDLFGELLAYRQMLGRDYAREAAAIGFEGGNVVRLTPANHRRPPAPGAA